MIKVVGGACAHHEMVPRKVIAEAPWIPVLDIDRHQVTDKKAKGMRPHTIYQNTFYKGLDAFF